MGQVYKRFSSIPAKVLKGEWSDICYIAETGGLDKKEHEGFVEREMLKLIDYFDTTQHYSQSLVFVKSETININEGFGILATIVQFRIRNAY